MRAMYANYVGRSTAFPVLATPGHAALEGLPPVRIGVAEYDDFWSSGELLRVQLHESDVPVELLLAPGAVHGFLNSVPSDEQPEIQALIDFFVAAFMD